MAARALTTTRTADQVADGPRRGIFPPALARQHSLLSAREPRTPGPWKEGSPCPTRSANARIWIGIATPRKRSWPCCALKTLRPLYYPCGWSNHPAIAQLLIQAGADPCDNESVYHAADEDHRACLAVIEKQVTPKKLAAECTKCLRTQLHWGHTRGAKWLLEHGADPNALHPQSGNSALHSAAKQGAGKAVIALLLKHGADPQITNRDGHSAVQVAKAAGKTRVAQQLHQDRP